MAKNDFTTNFTKFLPTNEEEGSDIFNVEVSSNLGIGSQLIVEVTASKGEQTLTANSSVDPNDVKNVRFITIVEPTNFADPVGACCVCDGEIPTCNGNVTEDQCDNLGGVWKENTDCGVADCDDVLCGSDDFTDERLPVARWTEVPNIHRGSNFHVTLSAEHYNGIKEVEFSVDGETPIIVASKSNHPDTRYPEYLLPIDVNNLSDGRHEVTAKVTSKSGEVGGGVLMLEGDPHQYENLDRRNNGINSFYFHTGEQKTVTVGDDPDPDSDNYLTLEALFSDYRSKGLDPRGLRVEMQGNRTHTANAGEFPINQNGITSALNNVFKDVDNRRPIEIVGMDGAEFRGTFGKVKNVSWSFKNMKFRVGNGESYINGSKEWTQNVGIPAIAQGSRSGSGICPEVSFINCTFAPDYAITHIFVDRSDACNDSGFGDRLFSIDHGDGDGESEPWRFNDWQEIHNVSAFVGGVYCVGNTYDSIALGPQRVTLSKHDKFSKMGWDHLPKNPAGVFDFYSDRSSKDCLYHQNHTDFIQYFRSEAPISDNDPDDTRNRMFCDFYGTNFSAQIGHFEGTQNVIDAEYFEKSRGPKEPSTYKDFYFTRWTVDSNASSVSMNFVVDEMVNWTVTDMKFSDCALDSIPNRPATGMIFDKLITAKLRLGDSGRRINIPFEDNGIGSFIDGETVSIEINGEETATITVDMWDSQFQVRKDITGQTIMVPIPMMQVYNSSIVSTINANGNAGTERNNGFPNTTLDFGDPTNPNGNEVIEFIGNSSGAIWKPRGLTEIEIDENGNTLPPGIYRLKKDGISNYGDGYDTAPQGKTPEYFTEKLINTPNFLRDNGHIIRNWWVEDGGNGSEELSANNQGGGVINVSWESRDPEENESGLETPCAGQLGYKCGLAEQITWRDVANIDLTITSPQALLSSWNKDEFWTEFTGQE